MSIETKSADELLPDLEYYSQIYKDGDPKLSQVIRRASELLEEGSSTDPSKIKKRVATLPSPFNDKRRRMTMQELCSIRETLGWTQDQMAACLGMHRRTYTSLENGATPIRLLHTLAVQRIVERVKAAILGINHAN